MKFSDDNLPLAIGAILFSVFALSFGDALIKLVSADLVLWQIFVFRSSLASLILLAIIKTGKKTVSLIPIAFYWTGVRSIMLTFMWVAYYAALPKVELSTAAAAYYTLPIFITLFAAFFIGEKMTATSWIAILIGFIGVLLILRPKSEAFNFYALLPVLSAILYALAMIITRAKCREEEPLVLSLALNISFLIVGIAASLFVFVMDLKLESVTEYAFILSKWTPMGYKEWIAICVLAVSLIIGSLGAAIAYQNGPASLVGTFDFTYVLFATLWGLLLFAEIPDWISLSGMGFILLGGLLATASNRQ